MGLQGVVVCLALRNQVGSIPTCVHWIRRPFSLIRNQYRDVAEWIKALDLGSRDRRFDSCHSDYRKHAGVAQRKKRAAVL